MTRAGLGSSRVELFEAIRRDARREDSGVRELARRYGVHRRTVRQALGSATPPPRKTPTRAAPRLDPVKPLIDAMLREDLTAPKKQRHTAPSHRHEASPTEPNMTTSERPAAPSDATRSGAGANSSRPTGASSS